MLSIIAFAIDALAINFMYEIYIISTENYDFCGCYDIISSGHVDSMQIKP